MFGKKKTVAPPVLDRANVITGVASEPPEAVIRRCGNLLVAGGYVTPAYIDGMLARDANFSVAIGNAIAIPHGEEAAKQAIDHTGLVILTYPDGVDWRGEVVKLVIGIAAKGDEHVEVLARIVDAFDEESKVDEVVARGDADELYRLLSA
jgi:mannitol/fructose-specific phosphotransferase system IIA component